MPKFGKLGDLASVDDPIVRSQGDVSFASYTGASLHILAGGSVTADSINITGADTIGNSLQAPVILSDGKTVMAIDGNNIPTLDIRAGTTAWGTTGITGNMLGFLPNVPSTAGNATTANINIGSITNRGGTVLLTNQYQPNSNLTGSIQVSRINTSHPTQAGDITLDSKSNITITNLVDASTSQVVSTSGKVTLLAASNVSTINGADIDGRGGNGGGIKIQAQNVDILEDSQVRVGIAPGLGFFGSQAGDIEI